MATKSPFEDVLLGTCIGDSVALPAEGMSRRKIQKRWPGNRPWTQRLVFGRGMVSDDTEHTVMVALALLACPQNVAAFQQHLARQFRGWFVRLSPGLGMATARACIRLWLGRSPEKSGVFSAGNGPAMRSAIVGVFFSSDPGRRAAYVRASTRLTHTDPKAEVAALAVAEAAAWIVNQDTQQEVFLDRLAALSSEEDWQEPMRHLRESLAGQEDVDDFARRLGLYEAVTGYAYHTVPVALHAWLRHRQSFRDGLEAVIHCGGDTDTVGAIAGALLGLSTGAGGIPDEWLARMWDWPLSVPRLRMLAQALQGRSSPPFGLWHWFGAPARNMFLLGVVILHGFRRLV